eukprot:1187429-Prorocentrum_minimum.AAC.11
MWKRRRALVATAAVGLAAAYIYRSERARRLTRGLCESADAFTKLAEIALTLSRDVNQFIIEGGEDDEVPRSVKQALRLAQCPEAISLVQSIARAFARGSLEGSGLSEGANQVCWNYFNIPETQRKTVGIFSSDNVR